MTITQQDLDQAYSDYRPTHGGVKEDYFGLAYLERTFKLSRDEALNSIGFGGNDYGVDGFYFDEPRRNFYLFQFKWSTSHELFKSSLKRLISDGMDVIFGTNRQVQHKNDLLLKIKSSLYQNQRLIERVFIHFVFNGDPADAERSQVLESLREELEAKKYLLEQYFGRPVDLAIQFMSAKGKVSGPVVPELHEYPLPMENSFSCEGPHGESMTVGFVRLVDLHRMYREMGQRFFERNIRSSLRDDEAPNRAITRSLRLILAGTDSPTVFAFNHNGVTIAAEQLKHVGGQQRVVEPRLLNGAQTVTTFDRFVTNNKGNERLEDGNSPINDIRLLCRVVTHAERDFITTVTISNNRQNPVRPWNLRANDLIQLELQDWFARTLKMYYERQENAFDNLSQQDLEEQDIVESKAIEILRLAQTFLASDGEVDKMSRMTEVFEGDKLYESVFNEQRLTADARQVILCYKVQFRLRRLIQEIVAKGEKKYAYMKRARNMVWALLCQAILNDTNLLQRAEQFGDSLTVTADYTGWLARLVSTRVRFLIGRVAEQAPYVDMIAQEKYEFVRSRAFYDKCMDRAHKDYGWVRKRLR